MLEKFPLPSFSLLARIQQGGIDSIKAIKLLLEKGKISKDVVLMADEMYLDKGRHNIIAVTILVMIAMEIFTKVLWGS